MSVIDKETEEFVDQMLDESLRGLEKIMTETEFKLMRGSIRRELLFHPEGQRRVRLARQERAVEQSGTVAKRGAVAVEPVKKKGTGS